MSDKSEGSKKRYIGRAGVSVCECNAERLRGRRTAARPVQKSNISHHIKGTNRAGQSRPQKTVMKPTAGRKWLFCVLACFNDALEEGLECISKVTCHCVMCLCRRRCGPAVGGDSNGPLGTGT